MHTPIDQRLVALENAFLRLTSIEFGDNAGHPFRGNQWREGESGDSSVDKQAVGSAEFHKAVENMPGADAALKQEMRDVLKQVQDGEKVIVAEPKVATLISEMNAMLMEAKANGETIKEINLCNVSVEGTNYFCEGNLGPTRVEMPQLSADYASLPEGAPAREFEPNNRGEVELAEHFATYLQSQGVAVTDMERPAGSMRATQSELQASKVANLIEPTRRGELTGAIFTSNDGYVLDGHHRWAAALEVDILNGNPPNNGTPIAVREIDMPMHELLPLTLGYTTTMGVPQVSVTGEVKK